MLKHNTFHNFLHNNNWGDELSSVFTWDTVLLPNTKNLLSLWNNYKRGFACRLYSLKKRKRKRFWKQPNRVLRIFTRSFETAIIIEAFGAILSKHIYGDVKHLVVLVVLCGSVLTHLWVLNKKKKKKKKNQTKKMYICWWKRTKNKQRLEMGFCF